MTLNEAMHFKCTYCSEPAMRHRMTQSGNFYCLRPAVTHGYSSSFWRAMTPERQQFWAISRAKCNELRRSPLSQNKVIANTIQALWQSYTVTPQDEVAA